MADLDTPPKSEPRRAPAPALFPRDNNFSSLSKFFSSLSNPVATVVLALADDLGNTIS